MYQCINIMMDLPTPTVNSLLSGIFQFIFDHTKVMV